MEEGKGGLVGPRVQKRAKRLPHYAIAPPEISGILPLQA